MNTCRWNPHNPIVAVTIDERWLNFIDVETGLTVSQDNYRFGSESKTI